MILAGFSCPNCGGQVIDSDTHCPQCQYPYLGTLALVAAAHHEAKMRFVLTCAQVHLSDVEIVKHSLALGAVSLGLATLAKAGMPLSPKLILDSFVEITKEV